jgi:hypothetical protein
VKDRTMIRTRPTPRGSTLLLAMVLLTVLSIIGVAAVSLGSGERTGAGVKSHRDRLVACASAAQAMVWSELARFGPRYVVSSEVTPDVRLPGGMVLRMGHYGETDAVVSVTGAKPVPCKDLSQGSGQYVDLTNRDSHFDLGGACYTVFFRCVDDSGQEPRELEIELGLNSLF